MRPLVALFIFSACEMSADEYKRTREQQRERLAAERDARWRATYQPMINAACKEHPETVECARIRYDVRRQFIADEREAEKVRQSGKPVVVKQAPQACSTIGNTTVCN